MNPLTSLDLCMYWRHRPLKGVQYLRAVDKYFRGLVRQFPQLRHVAVLSSEDGHEDWVEADFANFLQLIKVNLPRDWSYTNADSQDKEFSDDCTSGLGFSSAFLLAESIDDAPIVIEVVAGKSHPTARNSLVAHFPSRLENADFVVDLARQSINCWSPTQASVSRPCFDEELNQAADEVRVGWLTYRANVEISKHPLGLRMEAVRDGALFLLSDEIYRADDSAGLERLRRFRETLKQESLLIEPPY